MAVKEKNAKSATWDAFWESKQDLSKVYPSSPTVLNTLLEKVPLKGKKILEVGAGTARDSLALADHGAHVMILDFSVQSLKLVQKQTTLFESTHTLQSTLHLPQPLRADAFKTPFRSGSVDVVFHQGLLEHFTNPLDLLRENHRILKTGGYCLCDVPQTFHVYTLVKKILIAMDKWFAGWETQFTPRELKGIMEKAGFEVSYTYGDWMRPSFAYRMLREIGLKVGVALPKYPLQGTSWDQAKEKFLYSLAQHSAAQYTQLTIGALGRKK